MGGQLLSGGVMGTAGKSRLPFLAGIDRWWLVALPVLAFLALFFVYPSATILLRTFTRFDAPQVGGLDNLVWFFSRDANRAILLRTFVVAGLSTVLTSLVAFPYAYLMTQVRPAVRTLMFGVLLVSMFFGILLRNFAWVVMLQMQGPLNDVIAALGFERQRFLGTMPAVLMGMTHVLFPFMVLPLYAVLRRHRHAARARGRKPWGQAGAGLLGYLSPLVSAGLYRGGAAGLRAGARLLHHASGAGFDAAVAAVAAHVRAVLPAGGVRAGRGDGPRAAGRNRRRPRARQRPVKT